MFHTLSRHKLRDKAVDFFIFYNYNLFYNKKISDFLNEKSVFWVLSITKNWKINKKTRYRYLKELIN